MADKRDLKRDTAVLVQRVDDQGWVSSHSEVHDDLHATAHVVPTLASLGRKSQAEAGARQLMMRRDEAGGWDDPLTTVLALEAFVALKLRGIDTHDISRVVENGIRALRDQPLLELLEHELRVARVIVLAGLSRQDAALIDAGLLRARSALETNPKWSRDLQTVQHGLIALVDLYLITQDFGLRELIDMLLSEFGLLDKSASWSTGKSLEVISRTGTILEKLGHKELAKTAYDIAFSMADAEKLDSVSLKMRIELGVRLFGAIEEPESDTLPGSDPEPVTEPEPALAESDEVAAVRYDDLPAVKPLRNREGVSAVILQAGPANSVVETLEQLLSQSRVPDQIVLIWTDGSASRITTATNTAIIEIHARNAEMVFPWKLALNASNADWLWMIPSGVTIGVRTLETMLESHGNKDGIYLTDHPEELDSAVDDLITENHFSPERCLLRFKAVSGAKLPSDGGAFWDILVEISEKDRWRAVQSSSDAFVQSPSKSIDDFAADLEATSSFYHRHPVQGPEERKVRRDALIQAKQALYERCSADAQPLVSVVIAGPSENNGFKSSFDSLVRNTREVPFEVVCVIDPEMPEGSRREMEESGALLIPAGKSVNEDRNHGAEQCKGRYIVFLDAGVEVEEGWLSSMVSARFEEALVGIVGGLILSEKFTIEHAGVVFDEESLPVYLHKGGPTVLSHIHKRRPYQAVAGGLIMVDKSLWKAIGGFDNTMMEETAAIDFCLRARDRGKTVVYEPKTKAVRHVSIELPESACRTFAAKWRSSLTSDLEMYARMDGYRVEKRESSHHLIPIGPKMQNADALPASNEPISTTRIIRPVEEKVKEISGQDLASLLTRAETLLQNGHFDVAEETLVKGKHQVNGNVQGRVMYWTLLGDSQFRLNKPEDAFTCYKKAVKDDPSAERAWVGIGTYHLVKGDLDQAEDIFQKIVSLNTTSTRGFLGLGNVNLRRGQPGDALPSFVQAARIDPGYRPTIVGLVASAVQAEKMSEALSPLQDYLQLHPDDNEARFHLAAIYYGNEEMEMAREEAARVLKINPQHRGARELIEKLSHNRDAS